MVFSRINIKESILIEDYLKSHSTALVLGIIVGLLSNVLVRALETLYALNVLKKNVNGGVAGKLKEMGEITHHYIVKAPLEAIHQAAKLWFPLTDIGDVIGSFFLRHKLNKRLEIVFFVIDVMPRIALMACFFTDIICNQFYYFYLCIWLPLPSLIFRYVNYCVLDFTYDFTAMYEAKVHHFYIAENRWIDCRAYLDIRFQFGTNWRLGVTEADFNCYHTFTETYKKKCQDHGLPVADATKLLEGIISDINSMGDIQLFPRLYNEYLRQRYGCILMLGVSLGYLTGWIYLLLANGFLLYLNCTKLQ